MTPFYITVKVMDDLLREDMFLPAVDIHHRIQDLEIIVMLL